MNELKGNRGKMQWPCISVTELRRKLIFLAFTLNVCTNYALVK